MDVPGAFSLDAAHARISVASEMHGIRLAGSVTEPVRPCAVMAYLMFCRLSIVSWWTEQ